MKSQKINGGSSAQKKLKVITPGKTIECQPKKSGNSAQYQQIVCKENGTPLSGNQASDSVQFNGVAKVDVTIYAQGISIRFNGHKAWLKISDAYKNIQCGTCGHYDDSSDDEWRTSGNQLVSDIAQFHRSYALQGEEEECTAQDIDAFYAKNANKIRSRNDWNDDFQQMGADKQQQDDDEQSQQMDGQQQDDWDEQFDNDEQFNGQFGDNYEQQQQQWEDNYGYGGTSNKQQKPLSQYKVWEDSHSICVSAEPVRQCPQGSVAISDYDTVAAGMGSSDEQQDEDDENEQQQQNQRKQKVQFLCMDRSAPQTRRLLRQIQRGEEVIAQVRAQSVYRFSESVIKPEQCVRNRF
jgi:hypothetical protein